jgi:hypothetical protein
MTTDNISPPGAWQEEMNRMPWRYSQQVQVEQALAAIRNAGLHLEAQVLAIEITTLKNEIKDLRNAISTTR